MGLISLFWRRCKALPENVFRESPRQAIGQDGTPELARMDTALVNGFQISDSFISFQTLRSSNNVLHLQPSRLPKEFYADNNSIS